MSGPAATIRERNAMIANMAPTLQPGEFVFCTTTDAALFARALPDAIATFREAEGLSLILPVDVARRHGFPAHLSMRQITLNVMSDLSGVGLTAAVSTALADRNISCNLVAAYHHDHIFVPAADAARALGILHDRALANAPQQGL
jgi:hypothetical protein